MCFFRKLRTIFWRILRPESQIMRELCELRNIFLAKYFDCFNLLTLSASVFFYFARFEEDSFAWCVKQLKGDCQELTRWWSTTTLQVEQNRRLSSAWNFLRYWLARYCGVMLHGFFFGNLSIFKAKTAKTQKRIFFAAKSKLCLFSKLSLVFFSSNHGVCYIKTKAHAPNDQQHRTPGMLCLVECFCSLRTGSRLGLGRESRV